MMNYEEQWMMMAGDLTAVVGQQGSLPKGLQDGHVMLTTDVAFSMFVPIVWHGFVHDDGHHARQQI
jgi:hypothetical protein